MGQRTYDLGLDDYIPVDDRLEIQVRRIRLGFTAVPFTRFKTKLVTSLDFIGRDVLSATQGIVNNGGSPFLRFWELSGEWQIKENSQGAVLTAGYFSPQIGREAITGVFASSGMEKVWIQNYVRRHVVGIGPGRAMGINFGGLQSSKAGKLHLDYNIGLFNPVNLGTTISTGREYSPLICAKTTLHFGDPESSTYSRSHKVNYFSERNGLSLGIQATTLGKTNNFDQSQLVGFDILFNWVHLNVDGEWHWLSRTNNDILHTKLNAQVGYIKVGYNIHMKGKSILEPIFMISTYQGETTTLLQNNATDAGMPSGIDNTIDLGFNLYLNPKFKFALHLTLESGELGELPAGSPINNQFRQPNYGPIDRGDWIGLGLTYAL